MSTPYAAAEADRPTYPEVKAEFGEDPARYLAVDENDEHDDHPLALAHARIKAIDDRDLLKHWQRIEAEHWGRSSVMKRLNKRERELTGDEPVPDPSPDPEPTTRATATDGGQTLAPEPDDIHPDTKGLAAGEVLVLEYADRTDYIFPATPASDEPFLLRAFDGDDERTDEPIGLTFTEVERRVDDETPTPLSEIDVQAPVKAAGNGGAE